MIFAKVEQEVYEEIHDDASTQLPKMLSSHVVRIGTVPAPGWGNRQCGMSPLQFHGSFQAGDAGCERGRSQNGTLTAVVVLSYEF